MKGVADEIKGLETRLAEVEEAIRQALLVVPNVPDPSVPRGAGRERQRRGAARGRAADVRLHATAPLGAGAGAGDPRLRARGQDLGRALRRALGTRARGWSARSSSFMLDLHTRERGYREVIPPYLVTAETMLRHRPAPEVRGRPLQDARGRPRPLPDPDRRGAAHHPAPRRDPRGRGPAEEVRVVHALLPLGGRLLRQGRARADPPAPVPQGRAGEAHDAGDRRWRSWSRWSRTPRRC